LAGPSGTANPAVLDDPITVNVSASLDLTSPTAGQSIEPASMSDSSTLLNSVSVTFPAGVTTETVAIPVDSGVASSGPVPILISATAPTNVATFQQHVYLVSGPDAIPPTITNYQLITQRGHPTGIAITFSKPMAPATVENVHNYAVSSFHKGSTFLNPLALVVPAGFFDSIRHDALKAADYDPTTRTVTLIPRHPFKWSPGYVVQNARHLAEHALTDLQGNTFFDTDSGSMNGWFQIDVPRRPSAT
jgi:hypothetical protein